MNSINILPPEIKKEIEQTKSNTKAVTYLYKTILLTIIVLSASLLAFLFLSYSLKKANETLTAKEEEITRFGTLETEAKSIADRLASIKSITSSSNKWSEVIGEIQTIMPSGIYLRTVKMDDTVKGRGQMTGVARTKTEVASLRELMEKSKKFEFVDIEMSSTIEDLRTKNLIETFTISFSLEKGALK